jgi:hypothetical protein
VALGKLARGSALRGRSQELRGRSVFVATTDQLAEGLTLIEFDGVARRLVLSRLVASPDVVFHIPLRLKDKIRTQAVRSAGPRGSFPGLVRSGSPLVGTYSPRSAVDAR